MFKLIYLFAIFLIPFESVPLKISNGWNPVSYIAFSACFVLLAWSNIEFVSKYFSFIFKKFNLFIVFSLTFSLVNYVVLGLPPVSDLVASLVTALLPIAMSCVLAYIAVKRDGSLTSTINTLSVAYSISLLIGFMRYLGWTISFFEYNRGGFLKNAFTFSEPSFISFHIYGFFAFFCYLCWRYKLASAASVNRAIVVIILFALAASLQLKSLRFFLDSLGVLFIFGCIMMQSGRFGYVLSRIKKVLKSKKFCIILIFLALVVISAYASFGFDSSAIFRRFSRVQLAFDPSSELRYFRALTTWKGVNSNLWISLFGAGFGNICVASEGLPGREMFQHMMPFSEFINLIQLNCVQITYVLPLTLLASFGFVGLALLTIPFLGKSHVPELLFLIWFSIQFDSFANYAIALVVFSLYVSKYGSSPGLCGNIDKSCEIHP